jgi:hypothetical protein
MFARLVPYLIGSSLGGMGFGAAHAALSSNKSDRIYDIPRQALVGLVLGPYLPVVGPFYIYKNRHQLSCEFLTRWCSQPKN